ncbi:hypothetical protein BB561_005051 [Smittium simulii]|uniref:SH3 domain-containing protein n=1 Tax=Smittium simulii TaxID=133385 RepID=A0A2T9YCH8_9FUNG|nr:hypothetical protein BB561_005051 [Smittium simulii]
MFFNKTRATLVLIYVFLGKFVSAQNVNITKLSLVEILNDQESLNQNKGCFSISSSSICTNEFGRMSLPIIEFNGRTIDDAEQFDLALLSYFGSVAYSSYLERTFGCKNVTNKSLQDYTDLTSARNAFVCRSLYDSLGAQICKENGNNILNICRDSCIEYSDSWLNLIQSVGECANKTIVDKKIEEFKLLCSSTPYNGETDTGCIKVLSMKATLDCSLKTANTKSFCKFCTKNPENPCCTKEDIQQKCVLNELLQTSKFSKNAVIALWVMFGLLILALLALIMLARRRYGSYPKNKNLDESFNNLGTSFTESKGTTKTSIVPLKLTAFESLATIDSNFLDEKNKVGLLGNTPKITEQKVETNSSSTTQNLNSNANTNVSSDTKNPSTFSKFYLKQTHRSSDINFASIMKSVHPKNVLSNKESSNIHNITIKSAPTAENKHKHTSMLYPRDKHSSVNKLSTNQIDEDATADYNNIAKQITESAQQYEHKVKNSGLINSPFNEYSDPIPTNLTDNTDSKLQRKSNFIQNQFSLSSPTTAPKKISISSKLDQDRPFLTTRVQSAQNSPMFTDIRNQYLIALDNVSSSQTNSSKSEKTNSVSTASQVSSYISSSFHQYENKYMRALYNYIPQEYDELTLSPDQFVKVVKVFSDGWALVEICDSSKVGVVPLVCLDENQIYDHPLI